MSNEQLELLSDKELNKLLVSIQREMLKRAERKWLKWWKK